MNSEKTGHLRNSGVLGNLGFSCCPGKADIRKNRGYRGEIQKNRDFWEILHFNVVWETRDIRKNRPHICLYINAPIRSRIMRTLLVM